MNKIRKLVTAALLLAMSVVLPLVLHSIPNAGGIFLPMHIPVLLCGFLCSWPYGLLCGVLAPLISHVSTGMPAAALLPGMVCELAVYGALSGLLMRFIRTGKPLADIYVSLGLSMLAGRVMVGLLNSLLFLRGRYGMEAWITAAFVKALPGIAIQVVVIPALLLALRQAKLVELPDAHRE